MKLIFLSFKGTKTDLESDFGDTHFKALCVHLKMLSVDMRKISKR